MLPLKEDPSAHLLLVQSPVGLFRPRFSSSILGTCIHLGLIHSAATFPLWTRASFCVANGNVSGVWMAGASRTRHLATKDAQTSPIDNGRNELADDLMCCDRLTTSLYGVQ